MRKNAQENRYSLSLAGICLYLTFCGVLFGAWRWLGRYLSITFHDTYTREESWFAKCMIAFTTGLVSVAVSVAICYLLGYIRHYVRVSVAAFVFGAFFFWPIVVAVAICLGLLGFLEL